MPWVDSNEDNISLRTNSHDLTPNRGYQSPTNRLEESGGSREETHRRGSA